MDAMPNTLLAGGIEILRPFIQLTKAQIVRRGQELGVNFLETWTCYKGGERHAELAVRAWSDVTRFLWRRFLTRLCMIIDPRLHGIVAAQPLKKLMASYS